MNFSKITPDTIGRYGKKFSESGFWDVVARFAGKIGKMALRNVLVLFYTLKNPGVPPKVRAVILGALGYFISPFDIIPDFAPVAGMSDDIFVLGLAVAYASSFITQHEKDLADEKMRAWFGEAC